MHVFCAVSNHKFTFISCQKSHKFALQPDFWQLWTILQEKFLSEKEDILKEIHDILIEILMATQVSSVTLVCKYQYNYPSINMNRLTEYATVILKI